ncbi:MAG: competence protein ComA [Deltaproteobacteria bacterium]|nr:MAG: competence protein ComA [Deltaproteobacteria bacterium]
MKNDDLEQHVADLLICLKITIAIAESCTGGLICHRLTNISGSSNYLEMGAVTYSNRSKIKLLKVPEEIIKKDGAVSEACVRAMAIGVKRLADTDLGFAISGIAGPTGGEPRKPVGTVHMAMAGNEDVQSWKYLFRGTRAEIKEKASQQALILIRNYCQSLIHE